MSLAPPAKDVPLTDQIPTGASPPPPRLSLLSVTSDSLRLTRPQSSDGGLVPRSPSRKQILREAISIDNVRKLVRTLSGRPARVVMSAEDEHEKIGVLEYENGRREVRRKKSYDERLQEACALGQCSVYNRLFNSTYSLSDIGHMMCHYHPRVQCEDGRECMHLELLMAGSFLEPHLAHVVVHSHPARIFTNKFVSDFTYFHPLPQRVNRGIDPIYEFCHGFNNAVFEDSYCEDYGTQDAATALQEFHIELRENGFYDLLKHDGDDLVMQLRRFMAQSEYLERLKNPLGLHHVLALILFCDTNLQFEYNNSVARDGILEDTWKHFFCILMEAVELLAQVDPLVGQHVHCSIPTLTTEKRDYSIENFVLASKKRETAGCRFPNQEHTLVDVYLAHEHHRIGNKNICAGVADLSWLSRFTSEELCIIKPGQCLVTETLQQVQTETGSTFSSIYGTLRGNAVVKRGKEHMASIIDEITVHFGAGATVTPDTSEAQTETLSTSRQYIE